MAEQCQRVAIPRRFSFAMEEIWALQPRFTALTRKRVFRLLAHPRFRAAYDFLLLRGAESDEVRELGEWWTRAQELSHDELVAELAGNGKPVPLAAASAVAGAEADTDAAPKKKRRRRGGRGGRRAGKSAAKD
jgi:poly(A) polymerase